MLSKGNQKTAFPPSSYEYYWGTTCPHCKNVEEFMNTWDKKDKFTFNKFEVYESQVNANRLIKTGKLCRLPQEELGGVPLLVTPEGKCFAGDTPIIEYLKSL